MDATSETDLSLELAQPYCKNPLLSPESPACMGTDIATTSSRTHTLTVMYQHDTNGRNGVKIGKNCLVGAHTLIPEGKVIPDNSMVLGTPGKVVKELTPEQVGHLGIFEESLCHVCLFGGRGTACALTHTH